MSVNINYIRNHRHFYHHLPLNRPRDKAENFVRIFVTYGLKVPFLYRLSDFFDMA